jgi:hypothetical protein
LDPIEENWRAMNLFRAAKQKFLAPYHASPIHQLPVTFPTPPTPTFAQNLVMAKE